MAIHFVLVKPAVPENIGAAARAIKTMGFNDLRIVASEQHLHKQARILAHGAQDILEGAKQYEDLPAAISDMDWVIGTSAKRRLGKRYHYSAAQLQGLIESKRDTVREVAVVFGCEESGLSNQQLACCDTVSFIPIAQSYPSLNLGQAVMLYAYSLAQISPGEAMTSGAEVADHSAGSWKNLKEKVTQLFAKIAVSPDEKLYRWALERLSVAEAKDVQFLHSLLARIEESSTEQPSGGRSENNLKD